MIAACHLCGVSLEHAPVVGEHARHGHPSRRVACERCGLVQVSPLPDRAALLAYYRERYRQEYQPLPIITGDGPIPSTHPTYEALCQHAAEEYASLVVTHAAGRDVLELGAGEGRIARALLGRGYQMTAIEPDDACAYSLAASAAMRVWRCGWEDAAVVSDSYDAVVAVHSLEHLYSPGAFLTAARTWLRRSGVLIVEVPNVLAPYGDLDTWFFQHVHLYDFSPDTLAGLLAVTGYRIREMHVGTRARRFILAIAEPSCSRARPDWSRIHGGRWVAGYLDRYRAEMRMGE